MSTVCKANSIRYTFRYVDPFVKTSECTVCLSLYGFILWSLSSPFIRSLQIYSYKWKIWNLPKYSHTSVVLNTARISFVHIIMHRYSKFISRCLESECVFVKIIISDSENLAYSSVGYNYLYGHSYIRLFNDYIWSSNSQHYQNFIVIIMVLMKITFLVFLHNSSSDLYLHL